MKVLRLTATGVRGVSLSVPEVTLCIRIAGGILDTGNSVNTWSSSAIEGMTPVTEHEAMFGQVDPTRIEVTFTIKRL